MRSDAEIILQHLEQVDGERRRRSRDIGLDRRVQEVKRYQHRRFERTYADLLTSERYGAAARFFLDDLYGPNDFTERDRQFAQVVPALVRLFPRDIVGTVMALVELHALSEDLDTAMADAVSTLPVDAAHYADAWRQVGRATDRGLQIRLMLSVGEALGRYTRRPLLRQSLRLMRAPARAAGLSALQTFLEEGFDTFERVGEARPFLDIIAARERAIIARLFGGGDAGAYFGPS